MKEASSHPSVFKRHILPPGIILIAAVMLLILASWLKKDPELKPPERIIPPVEVYEVHSGGLQLEVSSQGTVSARTETALVAEVSGIVESISPKFYAGEMFEQGDVLLSIDPIEYQAALASAESRLSAAKLMLLQAEELARQAREDWDLIGEGDASPLVLKLPQLDQAQKDYDSAKAAVAVAQRNLDRCTVRAPYRGIVRSRLVNVGQMVNARASQLGSIFAVDAVEVRLPVSVSETAHLNLPAPGQSSDIGEVLLRASVAGNDFEWTGQIVRTEGVVDAQTRQVYLVAEVKDPYDPNAVGRAVLPVGMYVEATIQGREVDDAKLIPTKALMEGNQVYVVNEDSRLEFRDVRVVKRRNGKLVVEGPLEAGEMLVTTLLSYAVDGMEVMVDAAGPASVSDEKEGE